MNKIDQTELNTLIEKHNLYMDSVMQFNKKGEKFIIDEVDFTGKDLSELNFVDVYITESIFNNINFCNINFGGSKIFDCRFNNTIFENVNFGKTELDYSKISNSTFINCEFIKLNLYETIFHNLKFLKCNFISAFSYSDFKNVNFDECRFDGIEFLECKADNIEFKNSNIKLENSIRSINIGSVEKPLIIEGIEALEEFKKHSNFVK